MEDEVNVGYSLDLLPRNCSYQDQKSSPSSWQTHPEKQSKVTRLSEGFLVFCSIDQNGTRGKALFTTM